MQCLLAFRFLSVFNQALSHAMESLASNKLKCLEFMMCKSGRTFPSQDAIYCERQRQRQRRVVKIQLRYLLVKRFFNLSISIFIYSSFTLNESFGIQWRWSSLSYFFSKLYINFFFGNERGHKICVNSSDDINRHSFKSILSGYLNISKYFKEKKKKPPYSNCA